MNNIDLTKNQTFDIFINSAKLKHYNRILITSKSKANCIACGDTIYISFKEFSRKNIFCDKCVNKYIWREPTIAQYKYMSKIKDDQLKLIQNK